MVHVGPYSSYGCHSKTTSLLGTGEHGVGIGKREYLYDELGEGTVELMKTVKRAIDPFNLFNPGKVGWPINSTLP